jgi:hypothetical protein
MRPYAYQHRPESYGPSGATWDASCKFRSVLCQNCVTCPRNPGQTAHAFRASKRYIVFQVLQDTLALGPEVWRVLSKYGQLPRDVTVHQFHRFRSRERQEAGQHLVERDAT